MSSQHPGSPDTTVDEQRTVDRLDSDIPVSAEPPIDKGQRRKALPAFWHDRSVEAGMIVSMGLYYIIGNPNLGTGQLSHVNPLFSLPFLLVFIVLCWYRLSFAVALLPLALPYYEFQKTVYSHYNFSIGEITLLVCLGVAVVQLILWQNTWRYWLSWGELRDRLGYFIFPIAIFVVAAAISVLLAYDPHVALRAFREEIVEPLLYLLLALYCLRSRQDLVRLWAAMLATAFVVALIGLVQGIFFSQTLVPDADGLRRITSVYSGANEIGVLFDYTLPIGFALVVARPQYTLDFARSWAFRLVAICYCMFLLVVLYITQSLGGGVAIVVAALFIAILSIRNRKTLLFGAIGLVVLCGVTVLVFHTKITHFILEHHVNIAGVSTITKRLYLWQSAIHMIQDYPWFGVGLDNWLCHYSLNPLCYTPHLHHYWITVNHATGQYTGIGQEPDLSQPQNDILNIWVNVGIFGLLAIIAIIVLFYWLFSRILRRVDAGQAQGMEQWRWLLVGVGAAMLAVIVQGQVDSVFLSQDFAFYFWILVGTLLLLRSFAGIAWRKRARASAKPLNEL